MPVIPFNDLAVQYQGIAGEVQAALERVFQQARFILGEEVAALEADFASYVGVSNAVGVASGTEALQLALMACGIGPGDEVITVPNAGVPTVAAIVAAGARPILVDIHPVSYNLDPSLVEAAIAPRTRAILPVHLYGQAADMDPILEIAHRRGLRVIEDACQAHGAEYQGKKVGSLGDAGCFSFYPTKNLGGYGDGGMVVTNDARIAEKVRLLRNYGQKDRYYHVVEGINSRLDELQAAMLRVKLKRLDHWNEERRSLARSYDRLLGDSPVIVPSDMGYGTHVYHLYVIRSGDRDRLQAALKKEGVETLIHYPIPVHLQEAYRHLGFGEGSFPVSEKYAHEILSLPLYPGLRPEQVEEIAGLIRRL